MPPCSRSRFPERHIGSGSVVFAITGVHFCCPPDCRLRNPAGCFFADQQDALNTWLLRASCLPRAEQSAVPGSGSALFDIYRPCIFLPPRAANCIVPRAACSGEASGKDLPFAENQALCPPPGALSRAAHMLQSGACRRQDTVQSCSACRPHIFCGTPRTVLFPKAVSSEEESGKVPFFSANTGCLAPRVCFRTAFAFFREADSRSSRPPGTPVSSLYSQESAADAAGDSASASPESAAPSPAPDAPSTDCTSV